MSQFINNMNYVFTGIRKAIESPASVHLMDDITLDVEPLPSKTPTLQEYRFYIKYHQCVSCLPEELPHAVSLVKRKLLHTVYGDFTKSLLELEQCALERDFDKIHTKINELSKEVSG